MSSSTKSSIPMNTKARRSIVPGLEIRKSSIPRAKLGVFATEVVAKGQTFGPYEGKKIPIKSVNKDMDPTYMWELTKNKVVTHIIDGSDEGTSNYMRFVNCARFEREQNLHAFQQKGKIFYQSYKEIPVGQELLVWYGDEYAQCLGIPTDSDGQDEGNFTCQDCGRIFTFAKFLMRHSLYRCRSSVTDRRFKCEQCGSNFTSPSHLARHKLTHKKDLPYACQYCSKSYARPDTFKRHMALHKGEANFRCPKCDKEFMWMSHLTVHLNAHLGIRPYKCGKCNMCFTQSSGLQKHERIHTNERPYHCKICNKDFRQYGDLAVHTRGHTGEKPYKCSHCEKAFTRGDVLARHERLHTGDRPYKCDFCGKAFSQLGHVIAHTRIHTGERPFTCEECGKTFNQKSSYNTHCKIHQKGTLMQSKPPKVRRRNQKQLNDDDAREREDNNARGMGTESADAQEDGPNVESNGVESNNSRETIDDSEAGELDVRFSLKEIVDGLVHEQEVEQENGVVPHCSIKQERLDAEETSSEENGQTPTEAPVHERNGTMEDTGQALHCPKTVSDGDRQSVQTSSTSEAGNRCTCGRYNNGSVVTGTAGSSDSITVTNGNFEVTVKEEPLEVMA